MAGLPADTPVAAVRWGTRPGQRTVRTTLAGLADLTLEPPVTMVIGKVAGLDLRWFEGRPLFGRRIVVTAHPVIGTAKTASATLRVADANRR